MCNNMTDGGKAIKSIVKHGFETCINDLREQRNIRDSSQERIYYITGWILRASLKAAKIGKKAVREQLNVLVLNSYFSRKT